MWDTEMQQIVRKEQVVLSSQCTHLQKNYIYRIKTINYGWKEKNLVHLQ